MYKLMFSDLHNRDCYGYYATLEELRAVWDITFNDMKAYYHEDVPNTFEDREAWFPINRVRLYVVECSA